MIHKPHRTTKICLPYLYIYIYRACVFPTSLSKLPKRLLSWHTLPLIWPKGRCTGQTFPAAWPRPTGSATPLNQKQFSMFTTRFLEHGKSWQNHGKSWKIMSVFGEIHGNTNNESFDVIFIRRRHIFGSPQRGHCRTQRLTCWCIWCIAA